PICMTCGCCAESCPNYSDKSDFIGPAAISQVRLFMNHPTGQLHRDELVDNIMGNGGIADCGKSQNCVRVCPKEIPLTTSLADMNREALKRWFSRGLRF
ncbi:MAG: 4Fe-4S dicluster domain-containing protein, partial [Heliobacteriaceae bacterium]|nr:4Fe-4S dicluster domain-containing protein [Heliobacteriaceae bacterium]